MLNNLSDLVCALLEIAEEQGAVSIAWTQH
jgi:hypothetical protein